jgi:hypothetical protein
MQSLRTGSPRVVAAQRRWAATRKASRGRPPTHMCPCGKMFARRATGEFSGDWCPDCVRTGWRPVWERESGEPMPESLQALERRENVVGQ